MLCHSLRCWRSEILEHKVAVSRSNAEGKIKIGTCSFQQYPAPFRPRHLDTIENCKCTGQVIETSTDRKTGRLEGQIQTWGNTDEWFRGLIIERIRTSLEARIAQWRKIYVERMAGYSMMITHLLGEKPISKSCEITQAQNLYCRQRLSRKAQCFK